jgi:hypothetical protein
MAAPNSIGTHAEHSQSLTDRVMARVADARIALDERAPKSRSRKKARTTQIASSNGDAEQAREAQSLKRVFREMGVSYRRYRSQTHEPVKPALREAAYKFKAEPSLTSLVAVAAYLDDLDLLS